MTDAAIINAFETARTIARTNGLDVCYCPMTGNIVVEDKHGPIKESQSILEILSYLQDEFEDSE